MANLKQLQHEHDTTRGLWCIDRNPADVDYEWIKNNAFQLRHYLDDSIEEPESWAMTIGRFTLRQTGKTGKIWMVGPSGVGAEIDEKVLEDLLAKAERPMLILGGARWNETALGQIANFAERFGCEVFTPSGIHKADDRNFLLRERAQQLGGNAAHVVESAWARITAAEREKSMVMAT